MRLLNVLSARLRALLGREAVIGDIDEELRLHLEMEAEANVGRGMPPEEARRAALRSFGNFDSIRDRGYEVRGGGGLETLAQDVRYAARMLVNRPGFTAVAALTLALGVGANTAIFSVVEAVLLRDLPYRHASRVVVLWENNRIADREHNVINPGNFLDWRDQAKSFDEMAGYVDQRYNLTGAGDPEEVPSQLVTPNLFSLLGAEAALGRTFNAKDGVAGQDVAVISDGLWRRRFGGSPSAVGRVISLNGRNVTIIGVMPPGFKWFIPENSLTGKPAELWRPLTLTEEMRQRHGRFMSAAARLAPGVSLAQARAEMDTIAARLEKQYVDFNTGWGATVVPLREQLAGEIKPALLVLLGAVGFVLLIACVNVANLLLARATGRHKEIAIRSAIGAGRRRIVRQLLTESLLLALLGGALGLLLSRWCVQALVALSPANLIGVDQVGVNGRILVFTLGVSILTGMIFGLAPALEASRINLNDTLKESSRGTAGSSRGRRLRDALIVAEVGLALVLLVGAGLMIRSFLRLQGVDPGFDAANLLTLRVSLPAAKYGEDRQVVAFYREAVARMRTLPGVTSVSVVSALPFADLGAATDFTIQGRPEPAPGQEPSTDVRVADEAYFRTMKIPVLAGRTFTEQEAIEDRKVVVVNEALARTYFPGENPIGKTIFVHMKDDPYPTEIIGVVGDARYKALDGELRPMVYWTPPQLAYSSMTFVLRTSVEPESMGDDARREILAIDKDQPVSDVRTMESWLADSVARTRFGTLLLGGFAGLALLLAAIGIYGVMSHSVAQRQSEIGVRMALGARAWDVLLLVIRQGLALVLVGVALGLIGALALTRVLSSLLYGVSATDPLTFAAIALLLMAVSWIACYIPARRAARVDPLIAMRYD
ncbi:MAG TPA: ABC transporter permease [Thermoanaerobaculia bacterium]|jgi:putative ABC transport system permease protein|nr:ABC transporter permease [Thermoanaerobaculia bacterium]